MGIAKKRKSFPEAGRFRHIYLHKGRALCTFGQTKDDAMRYNTEEEHKAVACLECGDEIRYGRPDKKFCCESCKNRYNNRKSRNSRVTKLKVINSLERNHGILDRMLKLGMDSMDLVELKHLGFDTDYVTSYRKIRRHDEFCCFDIRFILTPTRICSVSRIPCSLDPGNSVKNSVNSHPEHKGNK